MGVSIEKVQWIGHKRWPCDQYKIMKNNRAQLNTKRHTKLTYPVTDFIPFLKDRWLKCQNQNPHERSQGEHPAGARYFSSNRQTTLTTQTKPGRQSSAGLCTPVSMADPWFKVSRLSGLPSPKQQTVLLGKRKGSYVFFVFQRSLSPLLCFLTGFCFYEGFVIQQKHYLDTNSVKIVYVEYHFVITRSNNNDDRNNEYDLP